MNEMTLEGLIRLANSQHGQESNWMAVELTIPNAPGTEYIINPKENVVEKLRYYEGAYNQDLVHNHVPAIKIVNYAFSPTFAGLADELGIEG